MGEQKKCQGEYEIWLKWQETIEARFKALEGLFDLLDGMTKTVDELEKTVKGQAGAIRMLDAAVEFLCEHEGIDRKTIPPLDPANVERSSGQVVVRVNAQGLSAGQESLGGGEKEEKKGD